jgi:hypothetical protein
MPHTFFDSIEIPKPSSSGYSRYNLIVDHRGAAHYYTIDREYEYYEKPSIEDYNNFVRKI